MAANHTASYSWAMAVSVDPRSAARWMILSSMSVTFDTDVTS